MNKDKEKEEFMHPSFGQISFSRISTTGERFYGSELTQDHYIEMVVKHSEITRELTNDHYFGRGAPVIKLRLSTGQFSELITSMNMGDGVPCTLEMIEGRVIEKLPKAENRKEFVHRKFEDRMSEFAKSLKEEQLKAKEIVKKKVLSKEDIRQLTIHLDYLTTEISSNIPFFAKCFQETMDKVVFEAKLEVENAIQHKINVLGLDELHKQNKLLSD